jgi:thioredoxin reductase
LIVSTPDHHKVLIIGGGPAGLPLAVVLGGLWPYYKGSNLLRSRYPQIDAQLSTHSDTLLSLDLEDTLSRGVAPADLFRILHHPGKKFRGLDEIAYTFRQHDPIDYLLITREDVGGVWNNVPRNLLTLSPGQWMEFGFYPLQQWADENDIDIEVNDLIIKHQLLDYYHSVPERFGQTDHIRTGQNVVWIEPRGDQFAVETEDVHSGELRSYTSDYLVYAAGQRCILRELDVPGADLPFVENRYDRPEDFPGERVVVVGGGRSADWAATELHDAGKHVTYVQRQSESKHVPLIRDSLYLPYYARIAQIMEDQSPRFDIRYETTITKIEPSGYVHLETEGAVSSVPADHVILEIGGIPDYSVLKGFPELQMVDKYDAYRFQVQQMKVHPYNYESVDVANLYPGGYLAEGIGLVVYAMHGTTYPIAASILQKEGILRA